MSSKDVAVLVGSLRKESFSRKLAQALAELAPAALKLQIVEIGTLPHYNQDLDGPAAPPEWAAFRDRIRPAQAVLFVTPEYNRSMPGVLKNAIDVGSRPPSESVWRSKPGAIISCSPGAIGGFGANHHLRQPMVFLDVPLMQQPEAYVGRVDKVFDADGKVVEAHRGFLAKYMEAFASWIERNPVS